MGFSTAFQIALAFIAFAVAMGLSQKKNVWWIIFTYWLTLTLKNILEVIL